MQDKSVHTARNLTTAFGTRAPNWLLHEFEAARLRYRPDLHTRQDAVLEAMRDWIERQRETAQAA